MITVLFAELGLADHRLGELHLCRDVGHRYGVVVVIGDVQSVLCKEGNKVLDSGSRIEG